MGVRRRCTLTQPWPLQATKAQCELGRKKSTRALGLAVGHKGQRRSDPWCLAVDLVAAAHAQQAYLVVEGKAWPLLVRASLEEGSMVVPPVVPIHHHHRQLVLVAGTAEGGRRATIRVAGLLESGTASVEEDHRPVAGGTVKDP